MRLEEINSLDREAFTLRLGEIAEGSPWVAYGAYDYHPFGYLLLPLFLLAATTLFLPASYRARLEDLVRSRQARLRRIYLTLIYGFITFGAVRIAVYAIQGLHAL